MPKESELPKMQLMAKTTVADMVEQQVSVKNIAQWTDKDRTIYTKEDIIRGYVYGGKTISVSGNLYLNFYYLALCRGIALIEIQAIDMMY